MTDTISEAEIAAAEALLGVSYSASERALMVGNLEGQIELGADGA